MKNIILSSLIILSQFSLTASQITKVEEVYEEACDTGAILGYDEGKVYLNHNKLVCIDGERFLDLSEDRCISLPPIYVDDFGYFTYMFNESYLPFVLISDKKSRKAKKWQCPYCYRWYEYGTKCTNKDCPTNLWDKNKENSFRRIF